MVSVFFENKVWCWNKYVQQTVFYCYERKVQFFPCTIQYFYFHSNSISTSDFIYDIFSLSRLSLVQTLTRGQETNSKLLYPVLVIEFGHAGHSVSAFIQVLFDFNSFTYLYIVYQVYIIYGKGNSSNETFSKVH